MNCPICKGALRAIRTRDSDDTILRRRECTICGHRLSTIELTESDYRVMVELARMARALAETATAPGSMIGDKLDAKVSANRRNG